MLNTKANDKEWELKDGVLIIHDGSVLGVERFACLDEVVKVSLPEGLKEIPDSAFWYDYNLKNINIPDSVESIGSDAFEDCKSLKNIVLPDNLKNIGSSAFLSARLESVKIPENVKEIGDSAFASTGLKSITLPENVKEIGVGVFSDCRDLREVAIESKQLAGIPMSAFADCKNLEFVSLPESIKYIDIRSFSGCESLSEITIPATAHCGIYTAAFENCVNLEKVTLGVGVDAVEFDAFKNCKNLRRIDFANDRPLLWYGTFSDISDEAVIGYKGREINVKDFREILSDLDGYPTRLSEKEIDDFLAKKEKEKKPEKKKAVYRGR